MGPEPRMSEQIHPIWTDLPVFGNSQEGKKLCFSPMDHFFMLTIQVCLRHMVEVIIKLS